MNYERAWDWLFKRSQAIPIHVKAGPAIAYVWRIDRPDKPTVWFVHDFRTDKIKRICL